MKFLKISSSQEEIINKIISGLITHENFNKKNALKYMNDYLEMIDIRELYGFHYAVYRLLYGFKQFRAKNHYTGYKFDSTIFAQNLQTTTESLLFDSGFEATYFFDQIGKSYDLGIPQQRNEAIDTAYSYMMDRFEQLVNLAYPTDDIASELFSLSIELKESYTTFIIKSAAEIQTSGKESRSGRLSGPEVALDYMKSSIAEVEARFRQIESSSNKVTHITCYDDALQDDTDNNLVHRTLFYTHITPFAEKFPYKSHDIMTIVANEGVGKTTYIVGLCYDALVQGNNIMVFSGETASTEFRRKLEQIHIWKKYQLRIPYDALGDFSLLQKTSLYEVPQIVEIIHAAKKDLWDNEKYGNISLATNFRYAYVKNDLENFYEDFEKKHGTAWDIFVVDHTGAMSTEIESGDFTRKRPDIQAGINEMLPAISEFNRRHDTMCILASHTDNKTEDALTKGKTIGARITGNSAALSKWATHIYLLKTNEDLDRKDQRIIEVNKLRNYKKDINPTVIDREVIIPYFTYNPEHQILDEDKILSGDDLL